MTTTEKIEDLIGKECVCSLGENWIPCRIKRVFVERERKWPYMASILIGLDPLHPKTLSANELNEIREGVLIESLADIEWE